MDTHLVFLFPIWNIFEVSAGCGVRLYVFSSATCTWSNGSLGSSPPNRNGNTFVTSFLLNIQRPDESQYTSRGKWNKFVQIQKIKSIYILARTQLYIYGHLVSFDFNVFNSSYWGYSLINTLKFKKIDRNAKRSIRAHKKHNRQIHNIGNACTIYLPTKIWQTNTQYGKCMYHISTCMYEYINACIYTHTYINKNMPTYIQ